MEIDDYYEVEGSGSPIVFIHGSFANTSSWKSMVSQLSVNHQCILIKLPGHCGTPDPDDSTYPTVETELAIVEQVVSLLTDQPIHIVGHSYGGVVALAQVLKGNLNLSQVTLFEPVASAVLDNMPDVDMSISVRQFWDKYNYAVSQKTPYACGQVIDFWCGDGTFKSLPIFVRDFMDGLTKNNLRHWHAASNDTIGSDLDRLQQCTTPIQLVCGTQSSSVAKAICDCLVQGLPNSKKYTIDGASHFLVTSHPNECLSVLADESLLH